MPSSEPDELLDSWLGDGVEGFTISAVCRNLGVGGDRLADALALVPHIPQPARRNSFRKSDKAMATP